ncbi:MAG: hypothetical protein II362_04120 [Alistipes sp.]|nr:hypothetical protein [Alistipes sp.]MBQ1939383.1 hypothetical protein [Alistipes sp.]MBQ5718370.1 hypothetical protein [Alistipes sp.]
MNLNTPISVSTCDPYLDRPPVAIYVHGLASGANASTFDKLAKRFPQFIWMSADFGEELAENVKQLNDMILCNYPQLIVGTSMGGLTVLYADAPNAVKVVCNPALSIADSVRHTIGLGEHPYFCRRLDGKTTFVLTEAMCQAYEAYIASHTPSSGRANYAVFAAHDELLGDDAAAAAQALLSKSGYRILVDPTGAHRLQPSTIELIAEIFDTEHFSGLSLPKSGVLGEND